MNRIKKCNNAPVYKAADSQISILIFLICESVAAFFVAQINPAYGINAFAFLTIQQIDFLT